MTLDDPMILRLGYALVHFIWQGALIAGILAVLLAMLRRKSPNMKYAVCWLALSGMALCVPLTAWLIDEVPVIQAEAERVSEAAESRTDVKLRAAISEPPSDFPVPAAEPVLRSDQAPAEPLDSPLEVSMVRQHWKVSALPWVVAVWLVGTIGLTLWRLGGWLCLRRYCRHGVRPTSEDVLRSLGRLIKRLPVGRSVELLESTLVRVPMVVGWLRPVILFPVAVIAELPAQQLEMILAHELAHIRRWDYLWNLIQTAIETLLFYHPAVWWVSRRIRAERECCCDELAAGATGDRLVYARALARLEELRQRQAPCHGPAFQVAASDGSLLSRIRRVLGRPHEDSRACYGWSGAWVSVSVLLALTVTYVSTERIAAEGAAVQTMQGDVEQQAVETDAQVANVQKFAGVVTDEQGRPLEGVNVKMCGVEEFHDARWHRNRSPDCLVPPPSTSDKSGRFAVEFTEARFDMPFDETKSRVNLWFSKEGYAPTYVPGVFPRAQHTKIILRRGTRVSGAVKRRENGQLVPVQGAVVYLQCCTGDLAQQRRVHDDPHFFLLQMKDAKEGCDLPFRQRVETDAEGRYTAAISSPPGDKKWYVFCSDQAAELEVKEGQPPQGPDFLVVDQGDQVVGRWSTLTDSEVPAEARVEGGNITFESHNPVFLHVTAVQKAGPDAAIKTVLDVWSDKPSAKYDFEVRSWKADQPGNGFVYGDKRVYRKVAIDYVRYDRQTTIEPGTKTTTINDDSFGYRMNAWIPSETGSHREHAAWTSRTMPLRIGQAAILYELSDPQSPDNIFFRLTICLAPSRPSARSPEVMTDDTGEPVEGMPGEDTPSATGAATMPAADRKETPRRTTAQLSLDLPNGQNKSVTVTLGQTASEIVDLCRPARPYADDDPWLAYAASGGGSYLLLFATDGTVEEIRGRLDPSHDTLYAVVRYPTESKSDGEFLLPETMRERTCGDFVTLKVPIAPDKVRVATVAMGMTDTDVMGLFQPASDHAEEDNLIVFDSIEESIRYRLVFSVKDAGGTVLKAVETDRQDSSGPSPLRPEGTPGSLRLSPDRQHDSVNVPTTAPGSAIVRVTVNSDRPLDMFDVALLKTDEELDPTPFMNKHVYFPSPHAGVVIGRTKVRHRGDKVQFVGLPPGNYTANVWADGYDQVGPRCPVTLSKDDFQRLRPGIDPPEGTWTVITAEQFQTAHGIAWGEPNNGAPPGPLAGKGEPSTRRQAFVCQHHDTRGLDERAADLPPRWRLLWRFPGWRS